MSKHLLSLIFFISIVWSADGGLPLGDPADEEIAYSGIVAVDAVVDHEMGEAAAPIDDDAWWDDPANVAAVIAAVDAIAPAPPPVLAPAPPAGGIVGAFVPPPVVIDPWALAIKHARANAHSHAFPFAAIGRAFLCNIQRRWLNNWTAILTHRYEFTVAQRSYPLRYTIPSFGWEERDRIGWRDEDCQMCGKRSIHVVVVVHNDAAPAAFQDLRVGVDCVVFMKYLQAIVWQTAFDRDTPVP